MKRFAILWCVALLLFCGGCGKEDTAENSSTNVPTDTPTEISVGNGTEQVIADFFAAWNRGDIGAMETMIFYGYGDTEITDDLGTAEKITVQSITEVTLKETADSGERVYLVTFDAAFSENDSASGFVNGQNTVKMTLLYDDEMAAWLISAWEKTE